MGNLFRIRRNDMTSLNCETLFLIGIIGMGFAAILMIVCMLLFRAQGKRLKKILEEEYGER